VSFFGHFFSFFRRKSLPERIENQLEERRLRPRVNPREGTRILVIDDSPTILTAMKRFLESAQCVFLGALDAKMGMEVALTQKPDLIFLDIVMPGINGFAALRALRKNSRTRETPIVMMSGNEQAKAQFFGAHIGADDFMKKPFSRFEVFARIARLLDTDRVPRRLTPGASEDASPAAAASPEKATPPQEPQPQTEAEASPAPSASKPSKKASRKAARSGTASVMPAVSEMPDEPSGLILTSAQIVEPSPVVPESVAQPQPPQPPVEKEPVEEPVVLVQAEQEPPPPVSAQVVSITPPPVPQSPFPSVSPELLSRIARLAQLAQSDPEALKTLVVLSAQLATQYTAAARAAVSQEAVAQARARAT